MLGVAALVAGCDAGGKKDLFNKDLSNAEFSEGVWYYDADGNLTANKDEIIFSKDEYENFEIELEFKIDKRANSGIVVYCTDTKDWIPNSVEIQIADNGYTDSPTWQNASIFGHVAPEIDTQVEIGEWNKMKVRAEGQKIDVWLNGKHASKINMAEWTDNNKSPDGSVEIPSWLTKQKKSEMATKGKVGLQGKHGDSSVWFKNVKIKKI